MEQPAKPCGGSRIGQLFQEKAGQCKELGI